MCTLNVAVVVVFLWLVPFSCAIFLEGPCNPVSEQSVEATREKLRSVLNKVNLTLIPVAITAPEKHHYSASLASSTFNTSFCFSATFGPGQCVEEFQLGINAERKSEMDFNVNGKQIQSGSAFVETDPFERDWLVYICQNVTKGKQHGHVAHLWILQKKSLLSRNSMRMDNLVAKYGKRMEQWGLRQEHLLSLPENEFEFCDEDLQNHFNRFGRTLFWFRTVVLILIVIMLLITIACFAIRFCNAAAKLNKVRNFSAN